MSIYSNSENLDENYEHILAQIFTMEKKQIPYSIPRIAGSIFNEEL